MSKLILLIAQAIAFIAGLKSQVAKLHEELEARDNTVNEQADLIERLKEQHENDSVDDAELEAAATKAREAADAAESRRAELQTELDALNGKAEELSSAINEHPATPNVDPDFNVTGAASQSPAEAEHAARREEAQGSPAPAPAAQSGQTAGDQAS